MQRPVLLNAIDAAKRAKAVEAAAQIIREGGIVAYPTESFYGLGADPANEQAIECLFRLKGRPGNRPILLLISHESQLTDYAEEIPGPAWALIRAIWPGGLTLVLKAKQGISPRLTAGTGKIGLRLSSDPVATALVRAVGTAITSTSANKSSRPACLSAEHVIRDLGEEVDAVLDGGQSPGGPGSTVLDMTEEPPRPLRQGMVSIKEIQRILGQGLYHISD
ncbi:MAG: threonylcarbamoyl-AMP synthase [Deltaproteobacteria bacterium]|nr:threonylcarbamoyl-AMP synthase [Deltaproteobacteria bacterium]MBW1928752.1 threonylcarbamoyl-AMP synthase [Deltaproteobacteria bacterium]MBW2025003.1 threonylcarbamoyl-AMP synthase [Deltaproteobacteria bacterium]MBW2124124.1 threonylcarbamoyl-AMP synthase [Deltaproteobacteria bacterium]RLB18777.1 MAG: threonylcarbamoyl-AMP synthase [Deltaproteobacteria bacterium]